MARSHWGRVFAGMSTQHAPARQSPCVIRYLPSAHGIIWHYAPRSDETNDVQGCYAALLPAAKLGSGGEVGPLLNAVLRQFSGLDTVAADSEVRHAIPVCTA